MTPQPDSTNPPRRGTILIADDEPGMRLALGEALRRDGWQTRVAESGEQALEALRQTPADLLITDYRMDGMSGMELLQAARALRPDQRAIMMTAYGTVEDAVAAMRDGAADYLLKPFSLETVLDVVGRVMQTAALPAAPPVRPAARPSSGHEPIAASPALRQVIAIAREIAPADSTVLLTGESGTGKEVLARTIHEASGRRGPFVAVNCAALPDGLLESELFGHEKGAFTGAVMARRGRFEQASGGTLLLDEISEMPLALQAKLLRVLQEKEISPIGGNETLKLDVRIIATTNRDLDQMVADGLFRQDLFYRLNVIALPLPPLRERREDILPLAAHFLARYHRPGRPDQHLGDDARQHLLTHPWPGNVRELENWLERACLLTRDAEIRLENLHLTLGQPATVAVTALPCATLIELEDAVTLEEMERRMILRTLERTGGNRTRTADLLGVSVRTIRNKLSEYGLKDYALA